jgi:hypothetical protein
MDLNEMERRELVSLRDRLRHQLRKEAAITAKALQCDLTPSEMDPHRVHRHRIERLRIQIGEAYREHDLNMLRAYFNLPALDEGNYQWIDRSLIALRKHASDQSSVTEAHLTMEHVEAYKNMTQVLLTVNSKYRWDDEAKSAAIAFVLNNLDRENTIVTLIREHDTLDLSIIRELLNVASAPALAGGAL